MHVMAKNLKRSGGWTDERSFKMEGTLVHAEVSYQGDSDGGLIYALVRDPHSGPAAVAYMSLKEAKSLAAALRHAIKMTEKENAAGSVSFNV